MRRIYRRSKSKEKAARLLLKAAKLLEDDRIQIQVSARTDFGALEVPVEEWTETVHALYKEVEPEVVKFWKQFFELVVRDAIRESTDFKAFDPSYGDMKVKVSLDPTVKESEETAEKGLAMYGTAVGEVRITSGTGKDFDEDALEEFRDIVEELLIDYITDVFDRHPATEALVISSGNLDRLEDVECEIEGAGKSVMLRMIFPVREEFFVEHKMSRRKLRR